jgi:large subunit ribosomal protein L29
MKSAERLKKIRDMSVDDLKNHETEMHEQMFRLRFQWAMGRTESLQKMQQLRKERARVKTVLREKEMGR